MRLTRSAARLAIPKILHHTWIGDDPLPELAQEMIKKWRHYHPDWEMRMWTRDNLPPLQNQTLYDSNKNTGHRADILRYELMYNFGGVYVDMDMECRNPIDGLIKNSEGFAGRMQPTLATICTQYLEIAILGSVPGHPLFARVMDMLPDWHEAHKRHRAPVRTGPQYFQAQYSRWRADGEQYQGKHRDFLLFRPSCFYPYTWNELEHASDTHSEAYAIHHWWSTWVSQDGA